MKQIFIFTTLMFCALCNAQSAKQVFERALYQEEVSGYLEKAVELYDKVAQMSDGTEMGAEALFHQGSCYLKLGERDQAIEVLSKLLDEYPQQTQTRLKVLKLLTIQKNKQIAQELSEEEKLLAIKVPSLKFDSIKISEVVRQLQDLSRKLDPLAKDLNIVLLADVNKTKTVSLKLTKVPLGKALKLICQALGLTYKIESNVLMIGSYVPSEMMNRLYEVPSGFGDLIDNTSPESVGNMLKTYLQDMGVNFPRDSQVSYFSHHSKLKMRNTAEDHKRLERILNELQVGPRQIKFRAELIEVIDNSYLKTLAPGSVNTDHLTDIPAKGKRVLVTNSLITPSGHTGLASDLREVIIASENKSIKMEVGSQLELVSMLDPTERFISFEFSWQYSEQDIQDENKIHQLSLENQAKLAIGSSLLIQLQDKGSIREDKRNLYLKLSADLINTRGLSE